VIVTCPECDKPTTQLVLEAHGRCAACEREDDKELQREQDLQELAAQGRAAAEEERRRSKAPRELVQQELARRELARRHLLPFVKRFNDTYDAGWVHRIICDELEAFEEAVVQKQSPRLIIEIPPRHGKSELVSRMFPAWFLGRNPKLEVIAASHTTSLAMDFSRKVRGVSRSEAFGTVFRDARISEDSQAAEHWRTSHGGGYTAVGVGSAVVGKGASALLIDDPVSGSDDAESFNAREAIKSWYQTEAYTRLAPGGGVMIIMQRWHDEDLSGWLQARAEKGEGEAWRVIRFPAIAEEDEPNRKKGEPLHPSRYSLELLNNIRRNMTMRQWEALYQQRPVPDDGAYFLKDFFRFYDPADLPPPDQLMVYSTWDLAIGQNEQNDYTAGFTAGLSATDDIYILDHHHGRWNAMEMVEKILDDQKRWGSQIVGLEKGHIQMTLGPFMNKRMAERRQMGFLLHPLAVGRRDKQSRARSIQGRMQQGRVHWPRSAPWLGPAMRELMRFPNAQHDDRADALGHLGLLLDEMAPKRQPAPKPVKSWADKLTSIRSSHQRSAMSA
jgi:predicted phage terminase large subunit-like protein